MIYAVAVVAQRHGIDSQELADRLDVHNRRRDAAVAEMKADGRLSSLRQYAEAIGAVPDFDLYEAVMLLIDRSGYGFWNNTGIVLDGRTDRNHSGFDWEELGPLGEHRLDLFIFLLAIGIIVSVADVAPRTTAQAEHGNDADDRGPPAERDVPLLTAAPSAPPAQAGHFLLLA